MAYRYQSSYSEAENENYSYSSMGGMGYMEHSAHNSHHGLGNGMYGSQMAGYSSYGHANTGYGMGHHNGMGNYYGQGYNHGGGGLASNYAMNHESSYYSGNNPCDPCKRFF
ncbi:abscisic acid and environmental stress-inducible protein-like [Chenopodium quinoa]|uniref:abscisic acid and environmental stress-inducible protein-like n=1 Tax=Chenopodium quinoa TaxID=63459 RepID=UPI000B7793D8|nr:abscisic acid and environmental stress-inducible protein-like [Chenopodium quinoa]